MLLELGNVAVVELLETPGGIAKKVAEFVKSLQELDYEARRDKLGSVIYNRLLHLETAIQLEAARLTGMMLESRNNDEVESLIETSDSFDSEVRRCMQGLKDSEDSRNKGMEKSQNDQLSVATPPVPEATPTVAPPVAARITTKSVPVAAPPKSVNVALQSAKEDRQRTGIEKSETEFRDVEEKLEGDDRVSLKKLEKKARKDEEEKKAKKSGVHKGPDGGGKSRKKEEARDRINRLDCVDVLNKKDKINNEMTGAKASATLVTGDRGRRPRSSSRFSGGTLSHSVYWSKCGVGSISNSVGVNAKTDGGGLSKEKKKKNSNHPPDDDDEKVVGR